MSGVETSSSCTLLPSFFQPAVLAGHRTPSLQPRKRPFSAQRQHDIGDGGSILQERTDNKFSRPWSPGREGAPYLDSRKRMPDSFINNARPLLRRDDRDGQLIREHLPRPLALELLERPPHRVHTLIFTNFSPGSKGGGKQRELWRRTVYIGRDAGLHCYGLRIVVVWVDEQVWRERWDVLDRQRTFLREMSTRPSCTQTTPTWRQRIAALICSSDVY